MRQMDDYNDPSRLLPRYESRLSQLPTRGQIKNPLWSDTYWSSRAGGVAARWQLSNSKEPSNPHVYRVTHLEQLSRITDEQLNSLSPAEKYDLATGQYDYPTVRAELQRTHQTDATWAGLCHAVAIATTRYYEPQAATINLELPNGTRRQIVFYSADLKALLALAMDSAVAAAGGVSTGIGQKCDKNRATSDGACWDTNPASFYLALANLVGREHSPVILDVDPRAEVWNAAVRSYSAEITTSPEISPKAARGTVRQVRIDLAVEHTIGVKPTRRLSGGQFKIEKYAFTLELADDDSIIGGEWISANRPDTVWMSTGPLPLGQRFAFLSRMVQPIE